LLCLVLFTQEPIRSNSHDSGPPSGHFVTDTQSLNVEGGKSEESLLGETAAVAFSINCWE
jgi:hypothetical protein